MKDVSNQSQMHRVADAPVTQNFRAGSVVDLFCGIGALSHGFRLENFKVAAGIDVDLSSRYPFEKNNDADFLDWSVEGLTGNMVNNLFDPNEPRILIGCAPCQPFSMYTQKRQDSKWQLLEEFGRIILEAKPDIVSMENVPRLVKFQNGSLFSQFLDALDQAGYGSVWWKEVECAAYGVPQTRRRLVLLASRIGPIELEPPILEAHEYLTVKEVISFLPKISAGHQHPDDPLHRSSGLSKINLARIRAAKPGGSWKDWDEELVAPCHKRSTGRGYASVYGRMSWSNPAPTITTQCYGFGNGRFGHPEQDRAISLREAALLQSFPDNYEFYDPDKKWHISTIGRLIGNAVPVELAKAIARSIGETIEKAK